MVAVHSAWEGGLSCRFPLRLSPHLGGVMQRVAGATAALQGTRGPADQQTRGPADQQTSGPVGILFLILIFFMLIFFFDAYQFCFKPLSLLPSCLISHNYQTKDHNKQIIHLPDNMNTKFKMPLKEIIPNRKNTNLKWPSLWKSSEAWLNFCTHSENSRFIVMMSVIARTWSSSSTKASPIFLPLGASHLHKMCKVLATTNLPIWGICFCSFSGTSDLTSCKVTWRIFRKSQSLRSPLVRHLALSVAPTPVQG